MDAWSATISSDLGSLGFTTQIAYTEGTLGAAASTITGPTAGDFGALIGTTQSALGAIPITTKIYSQASSILTAGTSSVAFNNTDPLIFMSLPSSRSDMWAYLGGDSGFPLVKVKEDCDDWGTGGWTNITIMSEILGNWGGLAWEWNSADFDNYEYDISYYKVEPFSNIISEFKILFAGLPVMFTFDISGTGGSATTGKYKPKMAPQMVVTPTFAEHKSVTMRYIPQKQTSIVVKGQWGEPEASTASTNTGALFSSTCAGFDAISTGLGDIVWGNDTEGHTRGSTVSAALVGNLYSASDITSSGLSTKTVDFIASDATTGYSAETVLTVGGKRTEVLSKAGLPVATLSSSRSVDHHDSTSLSGTKQWILESHDSKLFSYGESTQDLHTVDLISRTMYLSTVFSSDVTTRYLLPTSYSVVYNVLEDMFNATKKNLVLQDSGKSSVGRKLMRVEQQYKLFLVNKTAFDNGVDTKTSAAEVGSVLPKDMSKLKLVLYEVSRNVTQYDPLGAAGFKATTIQRQRNPANFFNETTSISDGGGGAGNFNSIQPAGPGYSKIIAKASFSSGEVEHVNIPTCKLSDAEDYADAIQKYYKGYYQVTETEEIPMCNTGGGGATPSATTYLTIPVATERPGNVGTYGLITSYSKSVTPMKVTITRGFKYYP